MRKRATSWLMTILALVALAVFGAILSAHALKLRDSVEGLGEDVRVSVFSLDGKVVYDSAGGELENHADRSEFEAVLSGKSKTLVRHSHTLDLDMLYCARRVGDHVIRIAFPYNAVNDAVWLTERTLIGAAITGALVMLSISLLRRQIKAKERQLADLRELEAFRRDFIANLTHELRTPLTGLKAAAEMIAQNSEKLSQDERQALLEVIQRQADRLDNLSKDILSLAKIEARQTGAEPAFGQFDLADILATAVELARPKAEAAGVELKIVSTESIVRPCDAQLVEQAIGNLIENAIRHGRSPRVELALAAADGKGEISVRDFGGGIPAEDAGRIFERFYRVDKSRGTDSGGTGLGLAIVKHVATLHGGSICFVPQKPGALFVLTV